VALLVTSATLPASTQRVQHVIDYLGAALLAAATTCLILLTTLGGTSYPWGSAPMVGLAVAAVALLVALLWVERHAAEPVLPLALFRNGTFTLASAISFVVGFALLGTTTFLPLFLQVVQGVLPTESGLRMVPLMAGMLITSIGSGQLISRWGRYKVFPLVGTATMAVGLYLLSRLDAQTSLVAMAAYMLVLGLGLGLVMQVLVIAVQNAVDYQNLGAATAGATFFRSIGSVFGVAVFGAIFANALRANLQQTLPAGSLPPGLDLAAVQSNLAALQRLPPAVHDALVQGYALSLQTVFLAAVPFAVLAFGLTWLLKEVPLRQTARAVDPGDTFAIPEDRSSLDEVARALSVLSSREGRRRMYERLAANAGVELAPGCCWLLLRLGEQSPTTLVDLAKRAHTPVATVEPYLEQLAQEQLVSVDGEDGARATGRIALTPGGAQIVQRLVAARREGLARLLGDWSPDRHAELAELLNRLAGSLASYERTGPLVRP
jgi:DNA-binding MarR family transcriptional regulator